ncbi:ferrochelatase [Inhella proteolytica]|uniref:Ferrochelatase n=1 Tax=Inhella proteolytica TaxID=2795029 RepID=A0A931J3L7_9BURK|nr:ferrochelatase [Inhella proteolytica]MBH9577676.1 ferrochelatase [Inhella proteolytica]
MSVSHDHGRPPAVGLLLCNLGSPDAPETGAVRRYLAEFLSDPRVVEIPRPVWWLILHGIILRTRPAKSAAKYASVWMKEGAPLKVHTEAQAKLLQGWLGEREHKVLVRWAMRYGNPSIASQLDALRAAGAQRILVFNAYPQYCAATSASVMDKVNEWLQAQRWQPELRVINQYHDHPAYIEALATQVRAHWQREGGPHAPLVMSFHGMPERTLHLGDPYFCHCHKTARLLAEAMQLPKGSWQVAFQSRFGRAKWLGPSTEHVLTELGRAKHEAVDVICPGFAADCLETLEEIAMEGAETFKAAGGGQLRYIPCLNSSEAGMRALGTLAEQHLQGWPTRELPDAAALAAQRERALALGAPR